MLAPSAPISAGQNEDDMISEARASAASIKTYSGGLFSNGNIATAPLFFLDTPQVLPNRHWIVLLAQLCLNTAASTANVGSQKTGIFVCPQGTPIPRLYGNFSSLPLRAGDFDSYEFQKLQMAWLHSGAPQYFPSVISDDSVEGGPIFFSQPFVVPSGGFIRGCVHNSTGCAADYRLSMNLMVIDEPNC